jgi:hypothetical protein
MMTEVDRLVEAERGGRLKRLGNWTLGQTLGHLAEWAEYGYSGCPLKVPFFIRGSSSCGNGSFCMNRCNPA